MSGKEKFDLEKLGQGYYDLLTNQQKDFIDGIRGSEYKFLMFHEVRPKELTISSEESIITFELVSGLHKITLKIEEGVEDSGRFHFSDQGFIFIHYTLKTNQYLKLLQTSTSFNTFDYKVSMSFDEDKGEIDSGFYVKKISFECELKSLG
jgi:hypothetical protein